MTSGFWPRVRARALRAPVFLGSLPRQSGRCAPSHPSQLRYSPKNIKINYFQKQNVFLQGQTRAARSGIFFHWVNLHPAELRCTSLSLPAPSWANLHPIELHSTLLSYAAFNWAMLHPMGAMLHSKSYAAPSELSCTLLSYDTPFWATLHPTWATLRPKSYASPSEPSCNLLSYAEPFWATLQPYELRRTLLRYASTYISYAAPL